VSFYFFEILVLKQENGSCTAWKLLSGEGHGSRQLSLPSWDEFIGSVWDRQLVSPSAQVYRRLESNPGPTAELTKAGGAQLAQVRPVPGGPPALRNFKLARGCGR